MAKMATTKTDNLEYAFKCIANNYELKDVYEKAIQATLSYVGKNNGRVYLVDFIVDNYPGILTNREIIDHYDNYTKTVPLNEFTYSIKDIFELAKPYDTQRRFLNEKEKKEKDKLIKLQEKLDFYQTDPEYLEMKLKFEKYNFKMLDKYYNISNSNMNNFQQKNFEILHSELRMENGDKFVKLWLDDDDKRIITDINFFPPPINCSENTFNTYDILPKLDYSDYDPDTSIEYILKFIERLCGNETMFNYFIKYLAHLIKFPAIKPNVAFFFSSGQGAGKDTLALLIKKLLVDRVLIANDPEYVFGKYNLQRLNKLVIILQEADNLKKWNNKIKDTITCDTANLANKGFNAITVKDYTRLLVFSNNINVIKIENDDRRWIVPEVYDYSFMSEQDKNDFFEKVYSQLNDDKCINRFYKYLTDVDIDPNFNFQLNRPTNDLYDEMREVDSPVVVRWLYDTFKDSINDFPIDFTGKQIEQAYNDYVKSCYDNSGRTTIASIGLQLRKYFCKNGVWEFGIEKKKSNGRRYYKIYPDVLINYIETKLLPNKVLTEINETL